MTPFVIRFATGADIPAIRQIYAPYVEDTTISFEGTPPDEAEFAARFAAREDLYPFLACEQDGVVAGYAYAGPMGSREGWGWSVETSIYLDAQYRRGGLGRALYDALLRLLALQGYCEAYALIAAPNPESEGFHRQLGFRREGLLSRAGRKFGRVIPVSYYAKTLREDSGTPPLPLRLSQLPAAEVADILGGQRTG